MSSELSDVRLSGIALFCKAAELGSFTAAAETLGITQAAVSRAIARLEQRLDMRLFRRTTRRIQLTEAGRTYFEQCSQALRQIEHAERGPLGHRGNPTGLLRVSLPTTYAHYRVLPLLQHYCERFPDVRLELNISNRNIDFVDEGYDLAIRAGAPPDARVIARTLEHASFGVFAAPAYLKRYGIPKSLEDLARHRCIQLILPSTGKAVPWWFKRNGQDVDYPVNAALRCSGDILGCMTLAANGAGLTQLYHFIARRHLADGTLTEVLTPYAGRSRPFAILYLPSRQVSVTVKSFVDFLVARLRERRAGLPAAADRMSE